MQNLISACPKTSNTADEQTSYKPVHNTAAAAAGDNPVVKASQDTPVAVGTPAVEQDTVVVVGSLGVAVV